MKKLLLIALFLIGISANAQVWEQGIITGPMTTTQINAISSPQEGRQVYNGTTKTIWYYNGTDWVDSGISNGSSTYTAGTGLTESPEGTFNVENPFTSEEKTKLSGIAPNANYNIYSGADAVKLTGTQDIPGLKTFLSQTIWGDGGVRVIPNNGIQIESVDGSNRWLIKNRLGYMDTQKDSTEVGIFPVDGNDDKALYYDYVNNRWQIGDNAISTGVSGGSGSSAAADITIADTGGQTTTTNVEDFLAENRGIIDNQVGDIAALDANKLDVSAKATQVQAEAGTDDTAYMTALKVKQSIDANGTGSGITWNTPVDANIVPDGLGVRTLGDYTNPFSQIYGGTMIFNSDAGGSYVTGRNTLFADDLNRFVFTKNDSSSDALKVDVDEVTTEVILKATNASLFYNGVDLAGGSTGTYVDNDAPITLTEFNAMNAATKQANAGRQVIDEAAAPTEISGTGGSSKDNVRTATDGYEFLATDFDSNHELFTYAGSTDIELSYTTDVAELGEKVKFWQLGEGKIKVKNEVNPELSFETTDSLNPVAAQRLNDGKLRPMANYDFYTPVSSIYPHNNPLAIGSNESNSLTGFGDATFTATLTDATYATPPINGSYAILYEKVLNGGSFFSTDIPMGGTVAGRQYRVEIYGKVISGTGWGLQLSTSRGWTSSDSYADEVVGAWTKYTLEGTASDTTARPRLYNDSATGSQFLIDFIVVTDITP